jgi:hypothetical protein
MTIKVFRDEARLVIRVIFALMSHDTWLADDKDSGPRFDSSSLHRDNVDIVKNSEGASSIERQNSA